jgi:hypothetical protein
MLKALLVSFLVLVSNVAAAEERAHVVQGVDVISASSTQLDPETQSALKNELEEHLRQEGLIDPTSKFRLALAVEGYFVRSASTAPMLRQQGGRDIIKATISLRDNAGTTQLDKVALSFAFEGFENLSPRQRSDKLHLALCHSVIDALR